MCEIPKTLINCELFSSLDQFSSKFFYVSTFIEIVHQKIEIIVDCIEIMVWKFSISFSNRSDKSRFAIHADYAFQSQNMEQMIFLKQNPNNFASLKRYYCEIFESTRQQNS